MKTALYHQHDREPQKLHVVKQNKNGTVDLAYEEDGEPHITGCRVTEKVEIGCCTAGDAIPTPNQAEKKKAR